MEMKTLALGLVAVLACGCHEKICPYKDMTGLLAVEGTDYVCLLILQHKSDGSHVVGGFLSDARLPPCTFGHDNPEGTPLQMIPSESVIVYNGKRRKIGNNGLLVWFAGGKTYEQELVGFPLRTDLKTPEVVSMITGARPCSP